MSGKAMSADNPIPSGGIMQWFVTGGGARGGALNPPINPGDEAPMSPLSRMTEAVEIQWDYSTLSSPVLFAGAAPNYAGLYQINSLVPVGLASGPHVVRFAVGGFWSNWVTVYVQ
jgi:uncharacterized protein (TIGR03437 family)